MSLSGFVMYQWNKSNQSLLRVACLQFLCFSYISIAFAQSSSIQSNTDGFEYLRKVICINGFWNTACSSQSDDILYCAKNYNGDQAQRVCQYELGLQRRQWERQRQELERQAAIEAEAERKRKLDDQRLEAERKIAQAELREKNAQSCLSDNFPAIRDELKSFQNLVKSKGEFNNSELSYQTISMRLDLPAISNLPVDVRPKLSEALRAFTLIPDCDSATKYYGVVVSLDGQKADGFLAYKSVPDLRDNSLMLEEIVQLQWLGGRIRKEIKKLETEKLKRDQEELEILKKGTELRGLEAKNRELRENASRQIFYIFSLFLATVFFIIFYPFLKKRLKGYSNSRLILKKSNYDRSRYHLEPVTNEQRRMQTEFRNIYPYVRHNVRFEHMSKFIQKCNDHKERTGNFPNEEQQYSILLSIESGTSAPD